MNVTYIGHSGFLVETSRSYYLFDYYKGALPPLSADKPVLVLASHSHEDHYQPGIFSLLQEAGCKKLYAILSDDIPCHTVPAGINYRTVSPGQECRLPNGALLTAYLSTDQGVAFLIEDQEGILYHAGDLNDWVWEGEEPDYNERMTRIYRKQIDAMARKLGDRVIDIAFVVLDPRQEQDYARGMLYFLSKLRTHAVYPMHYWEKPRIIQRFLTEHPQYKDRICMTELPL